MLLAFGVRQLLIVQDCPMYSIPDSQLLDVCHRLLVAWGVATPTTGCPVCTCLGGPLSLSLTHTQARLLGGRACVLLNSTTVDTLSPMSLVQCYCESDMSSPKQCLSP